MDRRFGPLLIALLVAMLQMVYAWPYTIDDVFISLRYGDNWFGGLGLVMNAGEYVKGYSNLSYTLLLGILSGIGLPAVTIGKGLGAAASLSVLVGMDAWLHRVGATAHARVLVLLLVALNAAWTIWSVAGLETPLFGAAIFWGVMLRLEEQRDPDRRPFSAAFFTFAVLTRPEGIVPFATMALHDLVVRVRGSGFRRLDVAWYALPTLAYFGELGWSYLYYGDPLPNTHLAKVTTQLRTPGQIFDVFAGPILHRNGDLFDATATLGGPWVLAAGPLALLGSKGRREAGAFLLAIFAQYVFICYARHDWMPAFRLAVPAIPFVVLNLYLVVHGALCGRGIDPAYAALPFAPLVALVVPPNLALARSVATTRPVDGDTHQTIGRAYGGLVEPGRVLASFDVGGIGWASKQEIVDTAGLTDRTVAELIHAPRDTRRSQLERYWAARGIDVLRRHPRGKGNLIHRPAQRSNLYLESRDERILIRRSLVLLDDAPPDLRPADAPSEASTYVVGVSLPPVAQASARVCGHLYWIRGPDDTPVVERRLAASRGPTELPVSSSPVLWNRLGSDEAWRPGQIFADYMCFYAPSEPGEYTMGASLRRPGSTAGSSTWPIRVVEREEADDAARGLHGNVAGDLAQLRHAVQTSALDSIVDDYVDAVVEASQRVRESASGSLGALHHAKFLLYRAYYDIGRAPGALRREIDQVERLRRSAIESNLRD